MNLNFHYFFTYWALCTHFMYLIQIFPYNTIALAIFICIGSEIHNHTINKETNLKFHIFAHYVPLIIILIIVPFKLDLIPIILLLILYLLYFRFDFKKLYEYYKYPQTYLHFIPNI